MVRRLLCVVMLFAIYAVLAAIFMASPGCQVGVSGSIGGSMYYPDGAKGKELGDPRKERYAPGNTSSDEHFHSYKEGR